MKLSSAFFGAVTLGLLATTSVFAQANPPEAPKPPAAQALLPGVPTVAVLNFENLGQGDADWDWLGKGLADLTIGDLLSQELKVVSREQMQEMVHELKLKKEQADPQAVARVLKAARWVQGTYRVAGGKVQLNALVVELAGGKQLHTAAVEGPEADLFKLQKKLSAELADVLKGNRPGTLDPAKLPKWTESLKASQLLYQGIDLFDRGEYLSAWGRFRRALRQDPNYADAIYWSGRMMYYVQEYHQARVDLERFCVEHPKHQRVGDAVMEIINAAQLTAANAEEVLKVLDFAARLAPLAEVPNQFGPGYSSTVGLYTAGLAAQILRPQGKYKEAFERYGEQIERLPVDHPLYWITWHEMFGLKVAHLKATAELLEMPPKARFEWRSWLEKYGQPKTAPAGYGTGSDGSISLQIFGGIGTRPGGPVEQEFIQLSSEKPTVEMDFSQAPLEGDNDKQKVLVRYFYADPKHFLTGVDFEICGRTNSKYSPPIVIENFGISGLPRKGQTFPSETGRFSIRLPPGTRAVGIKLGVRGAGNTILSWKTTAFFRSCDAPSGTLIIRAVEDLPFRIALDDITLRPEVRGMFKFEHLPAGSHQLKFGPCLIRFEPQTSNYQDERVSFDLAADENLEVFLTARIDPRLRTHILALGPLLAERVSMPYDYFRLGADMGDETTAPMNRVCFYEDQSGRWIVLWVMRRDLYMVVSADHGRSWTPTRKLPPPVNSAHEENYPKLMQDSDGRYILMFVSDRGQANRQSVYVCWSDDLANFSAPVKASSDLGTPLQLLQRDDGTYLAYVYCYVDTNPPNLNLQYWGVSTSKDLIHWSKPRQIFSRATVWTVGVVKDGEEYIAMSFPIGPVEKLNLPIRQEEPQSLEMWTSRDGVRFSKIETVPFRYYKTQHTPFVNGRRLSNYPTRLHPTSIVFHREKNQMLALIGNNHSGETPLGVVLRREKAGWRQIGNLGRSSPSAGSGVTIGDGAVGGRSLHYFNIARDFKWFGVYNNDPSRSNEVPPLMMIRCDCQDQMFLDDNLLRRIPPVEMSAIFVRASAIPVLIKQLKDADPEVRQKAAYTLAMTDRKAEGIVTVLKEGLKNENAITRQRAADALARLGSQAAPAIPDLIESLCDTDADVCLHAMWALYALDVDNSRFLPVLAHLLKSEDVGRRQNTVYLLSFVGADAVPYLTMMLKDQEVGVRKASVEVIAARGIIVKESMSALKEMAANDPDNDLRDYAKTVLSQAEGPGQTLMRPPGGKIP